MDVVGGEVAWAWGWEVIARTVRVLVGELMEEAGTATAARFPATAVEAEADVVEEVVLVSETRGPTTALRTRVAHRLVVPVVAAPVTATRVVAARAGA